MALVKPIWPELTEIISETPAIVLDGEYFIAATGAGSAAPQNSLMTFSDEVETTFILSGDRLKEVRTSQQKGPYRVIRLALSKPFFAPGFLASAAKAIALQRINQLVYSTYSFDYLLVNSEDLELATSGLANMGFEIRAEHS